MSPFDAWAVKRALVGHDVTGTLPGVSRMLRPVLEHPGTLPSAEARRSRLQKASTSVKEARTRRTTNNFEL